MAEYERIRLEDADTIGQIVLASSNGMNTMDVQLMEELTSAFAAFEEREDIRVIILRAQGRAFCSGGDIRYLSEGVKEPEFTMYEFVRGLSLLTMQMKRCPKPILAAVHGAAAGSGCNLALACDMIWADESAKFIEAFVNIGLAPDTCGAFWLSKLVGSARAFEILSSGRPVTAQAAQKIGMINHVFRTAEEMMEDVLKTARKLASGPALAYRGIKEMLFVSQFGNIDEFISCEWDAQKRCEGSEDFREGIAAFLEKRKPVFTGA